MEVFLIPLLLRGVSQLLLGSLDKGGDDKIRGGDPDKTTPVILFLPGSHNRG